MYSLIQTKSHSLFSDGMKISVHSEKYQHDYGEKWIKECQNIEYGRNNYSKVIHYTGRREKIIFLKIHLYIQLR
jgi:hypothetical protein